MKKLHLSIISLGLCLFLGFGSLAAQKGKKKEPKTTFDVSVVMGEGDPSPAEWLVTAVGCEGEAEGSNLGAQFPLNCLPVVANLRLKQISLNRKSTGLHIFFRDDLGEHYQTDDISLPPGAVVDDPNSYTDFDVVVNAKNVPIRAEHKGKPGTGMEIAMIGVGTVQYRAQPTP